LCSSSRMFSCKMETLESMSPLLCELSAAAANLQTVLGQPLVFRVQSKGAVLRVSPTEDSQSLATLQPGTLVRGFPAGEWLQVAKDEADEWISPGGDLSVLPTGAWVRLEGGEAEGSLAAQWSFVALAASQGGTELFWPGILDAGASYIVQWRTKDDCDNVDTTVMCERRVGVEPYAFVPDVTAAGLHEVRIVARLPSGRKLFGAWVPPKTLTEADRRHREAVRRRAKRGQDDAYLHRQGLDTEQSTKKAASFSITISRQSSKKKKNVATMCPNQLIPSAKRPGKRPTKQSWNVTDRERYGETYNSVFNNADAVQKYAKVIRTEKDLDCFATLPCSPECNCLACQRNLPHTPMEPVGAPLIPLRPRRRNPGGYASSGQDSGILENTMASEQVAEAALGAQSNSNVEQSTKGCFDGCWIDVAGQLVARIHNDVVSFADGPSVALNSPDRNTTSVFLEGVGIVKARRDSGGKLVWSDGDVWTVVTDATFSDTRAKSDHQHTMQASTQKEHVGAGRRSHKFTIGSGGGGAGDDKGAVSLLAGRKQRGKGSNLDLLPPNRFNWSDTFKLEYGHGIQDAKYYTLAQSWVTLWGAWANDPPEELPRVRLLMTDSTPCIAMLELFSPHTSNMLDPEISNDVTFAMDSFMHYAKRTHMSNICPRSFVFQGAGPHFCPGGNHHPLALPGATPFTHCTWNQSRTALRFNELGIPGVCVQHGSGVGGGPAQGLQTAKRTLTRDMTFSFGNLSRGAVPLMLLSKHISQFGHEAGVKLYLTDDTWTAYQMLKLGVCSRILRNNQENKAAGLQMALDMANGPQNIHMVPMRVPIDLGDHYARESQGFETSGRGGGMFQNAKAKVFEVDDEATSGIKLLQDETTKDKSLLKLDIPAGKTVWEMKERIGALWELAPEDMILMDGDTELNDTDVVPEKAKAGSIKMILKDTGDDWWSGGAGESTEEDYDDDTWAGAWGDDYADDYDEFEEEWYEEGGE